MTREEQMNYTIEKVHKLHEAARFIRLSIEQVEIELEYLKDEVFALGSAD